MEKTIDTERLFAIADKVELQVFDEENESPTSYRSTVEDLSDEGIVVAMPADGMVPAPLREGTVVGVALAKKSAVYLFKSAVRRRIGGHLPKLVLAKPAPADVTRTTRRQYFRVGTRIPTKVHLPATEGAQSLLAAIMVDLSIKGCCLHMVRRLELEKLVTLAFDLPAPVSEDELGQNSILLHLSAKVRTTRFIPKKKEEARGPGLQNAAFLVGLEFELVDPTTHNALSRYVAFRQRQLIGQLLKEKMGKGEKTAVASLREAEERLRLFEREMAKEAEAARREQLSALAGEKTVLLVDDEKGIRAVQSEILAHQGYRVLTAANGREGLDAALAHKIDLVITDLMMPEMNGWRFVEALREKGDDVPVIVTTGYISDEGEKLLASKDISGFLGKPVDMQDLIKMVRQILFPEALSRSRRILVLDSDGEMCQSLAAQFRRESFEVETTSNGPEALTKFDLFAPDLLMLDITLPGGFEVCRQVRLRAPDLPIVVVTAKASPDYVRRAMDLKINGYVTKPFDPQVLSERIRKVLHVGGRG